VLRRLTPHPDGRGTFVEMFRSEWVLGPEPVQWNMVRSAENVLRGVHLHTSHSDYITMAAGEMLLGLHDLRPNSPTLGLSTIVRLSADDPHLAVVPVGVAHGFYFPAPACHVYAVSRAFDGSDEFSCRWDDPMLGLAWPCTAPILSPRDSRAGSVCAMMAEAGLPKRL
jgi:dTDP-4-dehydrorhamnose 3,5-epimerase